jgi:hypothetical protein
VAGRLTRFLNLERPRSASKEEPRQPLNAQRFEPRPEIELARDVGEQPFVRCPSCEADNGKFAQKCINCSRPLDTPEVKIWNEQLWSERQRQAEVEVQQEKEHRQQLSADQRALGEAIAQEVGQREKRRLGYFDRTPLGFRLLQSLEEEQRVPAFLAAVAVFVIAGATAIALRGHPFVQTLGGIIAFLLLLLFTPRGRRD